MPVNAPESGAAGTARPDPASFAALIDAWQDAYFDFFASVEKLTPQDRESPGLCGDWNARQVIAHLAGWHTIAIKRFEAITSGDRHNATYDVDAVNAENVAARTYLGWDETRANLAVAISRLNSRARALVEHPRKLDPRHAGWLRGLTDDARLHTAQIDAWLAGSAEGEV